MQDIFLLLYSLYYILKLDFHQYRLKSSCALANWEVKEVLCFKCAAWMIWTVRNEALWCDMLSLAGLECLSGQQVRRMYRGTHTNMSAGSQHMKTIHIPKSMMSAPFLQVTSTWSWNRCMQVGFCYVKAGIIILMIFLLCNKVTVIPPCVITLTLVSTSAPCSHSWTETLPLQHSKCLQYRAHEATDEAALSQRPAHMCSHRCVSKSLKHQLWRLPSVSCCDVRVCLSSRSESHLQEVWRTST